MSQRRLLQTGLALLALSAVALGLSLWWLVENLRDRNITTMRLVGEIEEPRVTVRGDTLTVERIPGWDEEVPEGEEPVLRLTWRDQTHDFAMGEPSNRFEPGLRQFRNWFAVLLFVDGAASAQELEEMWTGGDVEPILVAVARYAAPGYDPESWGLVRRQEWVYELARLRLDGPADEAIDVTRKNYEQLDALHLPGKYTEEEFLPTAEERERDLWQYYAMLQVTPDPQVRGRNKVLEPLMQEMGLAWPAAGMSILGMVVGGLMMGIALRSREPIERA